MSGQPAADDVARWRRGWEAMMRYYQPDRDQLLAAGLTAVENIHGRGPARVLDIGGGPGTTAEAMLRRWPDAQLTVLDVDPVLLILTDVALPHVRTVRADLGTAQWLAPTGGPYDVVSAWMTVHYLSEDRVSDWYSEVRQVLRPGGLLLVADAVRKPEAVGARRPGAGADPWSAWWSTLAGTPAMTSLLRERADVLAGLGCAEFVAPIGWHRHTARRAGYTDAELLFHRGDHALMAFHPPADRP
ncbi:class I SAM-dependent methyltransferase [Micromonospora sp. NPDC049891]|uniref:class I SAM-dependent methyltransferase n=1 Tax=Micromonospora sp. NPDC049891 TaxID=3155655 RepID=UPI0033D33159